ncbi:hypothetical protein [Actinoallomurus oryzae]|jgi:hypothetical protein
MDPHTSLADMGADGDTASSVSIYTDDRAWGASPQCHRCGQWVCRQDWTKGVEYREQVTARCASCGADSGGGRFCRECGARQASAPQAAKMFCTNCGTNLGDAKFCGGCGWPAG